MGMQDRIWESQDCGMGCWGHWEWNWDPKMGMGTLGMGTLGMGMGTVGREWEQGQEWGH